MLVLFILISFSCLNSLACNSGVWCKSVLALFLKSGKALRIPTVVQMFAIYTLCEIKNGFFSSLAEQFHLEWKLNLIITLQMIM